MLVDDSSLQRKEIVMHVIVFTCIAVAVLLYDWESETVFLLNRYLAWLYVTLAVITLSIFRVSSFLSIYGLFFITSNVFICGRFYAHFILDSDPFSSPVSNNYYPSDLEKIRLMYYVILSFVVVHLGYLLQKCLFDYDALPELKSPFKEWMYTNRKQIARAFFAISVIYCGITFKSLAQVFATGSYLGLYEFQGEEYSTSIVAVFKVAFVFLFGVVFAIADKRDRRIALAISVVVGIAYFMIGTRSSFISSVLFIVWYFHNYEKKVSFFKVGLAGVFVVFASQYLIGLTLRGVGLDGMAVSPIDLLAFFLHDQGVTLMVFEFSFQFSEWPAVLYFQSLFPGVNALTSLFGGGFGSQYSNIGNYLAYTVNSTAFFNGNALGWSMFGDFSMYSFGSKTGFILVGLLWGGFVSFLESYSRRSVIVRALALSTFSSIVISPRGGFCTVFPNFLYYAIFWLLFYMLWKRFSIRTSIAEPGS